MPTAGDAAIQTVGNQSVIASEIENLPTGSSANVTASVDTSFAYNIGNFGQWRLLQTKLNGTLTDYIPMTSDQGVSKQAGEGFDIRNYSDASRWNDTNRPGNANYGIQQRLDMSGFINVSGILKLTVGTINGNRANVNWEFWGTGRNGAAVHESNTRNLTLTEGTPVNLTNGTTSDPFYGRIQITDISKLSTNEELYFQIISNKSRSGPVANNNRNSLTFNLEGQTSTGQDLFTYTPTVTLSQNDSSLTDISNDGINIAYLPYIDSNGSLDLSKFANGTNQWSKFNIQLKATGTNLTPADIANLNNATIVNYTWGIDAVDEVNRIDAPAGSAAIKTSKLRDLAQFYEYGDKFLLDEPKTVTIIQGDGQTANVTLYADDTIEDAANKLNAAIAKDLGQAKYVKSGDEGNFVKFITEEDAEEYKNTSESVAGTMVIHSAIAGQAGRLRFAGDEAVLNALGLNTLQDASETTYTVNISDAHTGGAVLSNAKLTGNRLIGAIGANVDIEFDRMAGLTAKWDEKERDFDYEKTEYKTVLHLSDNTTTLQIGANQGEIMRLNIGSMTTSALNLDAATLMTRESANRAITMLDTAIDKVAMQRAKIGAMENRLEHRISSITTARENLSNAESRIRDADMAKSAVKFAKLQIMMQSEIGVTAQANQVAQSVLNLMR